MRRSSSCSDRVPRAAALAALFALLAPSCKCGGEAPTDVAALAASVASAPAGSTAPLASASAPAAVASAPAGPGVDAGRSDAGPDHAAGECPDFDPERWTPYEAFPRTTCWLFTPAARDKLPRPLAWAPCARPELGARCRRLDLPKGERLSFAGSEADYRGAELAPGGKPPARLQLMLECEKLRSLVYVAADADGPVFGAMAIDPDWRCGFAPELRAAGWAADLRIQEPSEDGDPTSEGAPSIVAGLLAARGQLVPTRLDDAVPSEGPDETRLFRRWHPYNQVREVRAAIGMPKDGPNTRAFFGTDGTDIVWSAGERGGECTVYTARYVEDPREAVPTRVVALPCRDTDAAWKLACGFAATTTAEGETLVVRLRDGTTYRIPKLSAPLDRGPSAPTFPLAITCAEVFLAAGGARPTILRIPLDALPGATPAPEPPRPFGSTAGEADAGTEGGP